VGAEVAPPTGLPRNQNVLTCPLGRLKALPVVLARPMHAKKISADLLFATFGEVSQKVVGYLVLVLLARHLDKGSMGEFFVAATIATVAAAITELGTGRHLVRLIAATPADALAHLGGVLSLRLPVTAGALVIVNAGVYLLEPALGSVMLLTSCYVLVGDLYYSYSAFLIGRRFLGLRLVTLLAGQLLLVACVGVSVLAGGSLQTVLLAYVAANVITVGATALLVRRRFGLVPLSRPSARSWQLARVAAPFGALTVLGLLHSKVDTLLLYRLSSAATVATYESAYKLLEVSRFLVRPAVTVFFPICAALAAAENWAGFELAYKRLLRAAGGLGMLVAALVISLAGVVVPTIWGASYADAVPIVRVLYLSVPLLYLQLVALFLAGSVHLERAALWAVAAAFGGNLALNLIAIPWWGAIGASVTTLISEAALTVWLLCLIRNHLRHVRQPGGVVTERPLATSASAA
jgi:O-antigen/teichoic acid export membrane protein